MNHNGVYRRRDAAASGQTSSVTPWFRFSRDPNSFIDFDAFSTENVVRAFQEKVRVPADGKFGPLTRDATISLLESERDRLFERSEGAVDQAVLDRLNKGIEDAEALEDGQALPLTLWSMIANDALEYMGVVLDDFGYMGVIDDDVVNVFAGSPIYYASAGESVVSFFNRNKVPVAVTGSVLLIGGIAAIYLSTREESF